MSATLRSGWAKRSLLLSTLVSSYLALPAAATLPSSSPHAYDGQPDGDYNSTWQQYFLVEDKLTGVAFDLGNSYAGNIGVQRAGHPDNALFFWAFEHQNGSLAAQAGQNGDQPWAVWLQGGPGTSSMVGLMTENGPIHLEPGTQKLSENKYAWSDLIDYIWVDNPVGVGFSTVDADGYAADEDQVAEDFVGFLDNLVKVFPSLSTRPFYLTGESYAGRYIPYIAKALFSMNSPPVKLSKLAIGNPALGSVNEFKILPTLSVLQTYPQIIGYNTTVYDYFKEQAHLCNLDVNLTYPQTGGTFPPISVTGGSSTESQNSTRDNDLARKLNKLGLKGPHTKRGFVSEVASRHAARQTADDGARIAKRDASGARTFSSTAPIDAWYGCDVWDEMLDYAVNYTFPWSKYELNTFDIPDGLDPDPSDNPTFFFTDDKVVRALHAPLNVDWTSSIDYPWNSQANGTDTSPEPATFLTQLAANATAHSVDFIFYVGNDDALSPHFGTEVTIQNTTFGGIQGFTRKPGTSWYDDNGDWAGIVHQERNWTYAVVYGTGHEVPAGRPVAAYTFLREFIVGSNQTGLVQTSGNSTAVVGGENPTLQQTAIPGQAGIDYGVSSTQSSTVWPSATVAAFESHIGQAAVTGTGAVKPAKTASAAVGKKGMARGGSVVAAVAFAKMVAEMV